MNQSTTRVFVPSTQSLPSFNPIRQEQVDAKQALEAMGIDTNLCRDNQYYFLNELIKSAKSNNLEQIDILHALINGGKSHTITYNVISLLKLAEKDVMFIPSYYGSVAEQFKQDMLTKKFIDTALSQLGDNESLLLIIDSKKNEVFNPVGKPNQHATSAYTLNSVKNDVAILSNRKISVDHFDQLEFDLQNSIDNHTYTIIIGTLQATNKKVASDKAIKLQNILKDKNVISTVDEIHAGMPCTIQLDGTGYKASTGHPSEETYHAVFFETLREIGKTHKIIGISGTPTIAHKEDEQYFLCKNHLINKDEIKDYSKKVLHKVIDNDSDRLFAAIDYTIAFNNTINKFLGTTNKTYVTCPIVIPNEGKTKDLYINEVRDYIRRKFNITDPAVVAKYYGTSADTMSLSMLVESAENIDSKLMFIVVKQKLAAGVNIKNICTFTMVKTAINNGQVWRSLIQLWGRGIRPNNNFLEHQELHTSMNVCMYFLAEAHVLAWDEFTSDFAFEVK